MSTINYRASQFKDSSSKGTGQCCQKIRGLSGPKIRQDISGVICSAQIAFSVLGDQPVHQYYICLKDKATVRNNGDPGFVATGKLITTITSSCASVLPPCRHLLWNKSVFQFTLYCLKVALG